MKALTFLATLLALAAIALTLTSLGSTSTRAISAASPDLTSVQNGIAALERTARKIEERLRHLEDRQAQLELKSGQAPVPRQAIDDPTEVATVTPELKEQLAQTFTDRNAAPTVALESLVNEVIEHREKVEREEREERRRQAAEERITRRVEQLTERLGLDPRQAKDMRTVLTNEQLRREELFTTLREEGTFDREAAREGMQKLRTDVQTELQTFLTPDQYQTYVDTEDRGFRGGGRDGGGGRNGGGGGRDGGGNRGGNRGGF